MRSVRVLVIAAACALVARAAAAQAPPPPAQQLDWCADVVVRPDMRTRPTADGCELIWRPEEAAAAGLVMLGAHDDVSDPRLAHPGLQCTGPTSHAANGRYVAKLRSLRAGGKPLRVVHYSRFDLVADTLAGLPGFDPDFLVKTKRPWPDVMRFIESDRSPQCGRGCRWSDAWGAWEDRGKGTWLRDRIDARGGKGRSESAIYFIVRAAQVKDRYWPVGVLADLRNPGYRAFRVAEAKRAMEQGGYDAIGLNQKFHYFYEPHWIASATVPDAAAMRAKGDDTWWTGPPENYDLDEYLRGWIALAADFRAADIPYAFTEALPWPWLFRPGDGRVKDPALLRGLREALLGARIVVIERKTFDPAGRAAFVAELSARGGEPVWVDTGCGFLRK
jgi:hypothetical protein